MTYVYVFLILIAQAIIQLTFIGIMVEELFDRNRKDRATVFWLSLILFFWLLFIGISEYGLVSGGISIISSWVALFCLAVAFAKSQ